MEDIEHSKEVCNYIVPAILKVLIILDNTIEQLNDSITFNTPTSSSDTSRSLLFQ